MNTIEKQYPTDKALVAAREYSTWLHDRFTRGPLGDFFGRSRSNATFISDPSKRALSAVKREKTGKQIFTAAEELQRPQLEAAAAGYVNSEFQRIAAEIGPEAAEKFLSAPTTRRFMQEFPKSFTDYDLNATRLGRAIQEQKTLERSAFMKFSEQDPQAAIDSLFLGSNKVERVRDISRQLERDDTQLAQKAFKSGLIEALWRRAGENPERMQRLLKQKDLRAMFQEALGSETMGRLNRAIDSAASIKAGQGGIGARAQSLIARFLGAGIARGGGARTIQQTAAGATLMDAVYKKVTGIAPPEVFFANAVLDPKWERYLYSQSPKNIRELRKNTDLIRALVFGIQGTEEVLDSSELE